MDIQWWGYLHINGAVQTKRYFGKQDIREAMESDFVAQTVGPFNALNRGQAVARVMHLLKLNKE